MIVARHAVPIDVFSPAGEYNPLWQAMQLAELVKSFVPSSVAVREALARSMTDRSDAPEIARTHPSPATAMNRSITTYQPENKGPSNQSQRRYKWNTRPR
jgi:hypothetical protein